MTVSSTTAPPPYEHSSLLNSSAAKHGFFGRRGGVSTGIFDSLNTGFGSNDDKALVGENRRRCAKVFGLPQDALLTCRQVHSSVCVVTRSKWDDQSPPTADAMVTDTKGIAIGVLTADCMPVLFLDERSGIIGAAHAGWKGALAGILENTVKAMGELGSKAGDIRACIGPCLRPPNFEIGDDLY
ncbi:MAG: polyphenol oxidase family protein, partial [Pseudomonadota bacterium]